MSLEELERDFKRALAFLLEQRFIMRGASRPPALPSTWQSEDDTASMEVDDDQHEEQVVVSLEITQLGMATFFSAMAPRDAQLALQDMAAARGGLVLTSDLHLLFFSVPGGRHYFSPPYEYLCRTCGSWGTGVRDVAERVGLTPERLERARRQAQDRQRGVAGSEDELVVRFANAVALHDQLQEVPLVKVAQNHLLTAQLEAPNDSLMRLLLPCSWTAVPRTAGPCSGCGRTRPCTAACWSASAASSNGRRSPRSSPRCRSDNPATPPPLLLLVLLSDPVAAVVGAGAVSARRAGGAAAAGAAGVGHHAHAEGQSTLRRRIHRAAQPRTGQGMDGT